ncbi:sulfotransferase family protein [Aestuariivirga litoralis]|uniref:sulfotransferase family protein n=1 Tax=Aestuariivirga litoralis TaxID=2650924 RepID=UPI0018C668DB|nr:sulfotransferase family protein [Aestuariivirga litoralis]MBG1231745.1 sulfotransferase family protein [Aestuariivirga litoralis]
MTLKVIGTGFGRTGTDSMREALDILGFGPCHHMHEVIAHEQQKQMWRAKVQGAPLSWEELFAGYQSCVDWPSAYYWRELITAYPQAKVILTHRSAESWWASFEKTILAGLSKSTDPQSVGLALIRDKVFGGKMNDKAHAMACYEANIKAIRETVPAARLLVHELGDGWVPLCAHLGVPVPAVDYPSANSAEAFNTRHLQNPNAGHHT